MSKTIRTVTPEMHAALDAYRQGKVSHEARRRIDTAHAEWEAYSHYAHPHHFEHDTDGDRAWIDARRRRDGAHRRYLTLCHRIGRNYYRPIALKRGMSPMRRAEIAGYVRDVHEDICEIEGTPPSREELMCLAALFAAGDDDGKIIPALQDLAVEAGLIASHVANTLTTRPEPALPEEVC